MKADASDVPRAVLLADLVGSRTTSDRAAVHRRLGEVLEQANAVLDPLTPLRITVGDEYQGSFARVGEALHAALWLRLALAGGEPGIDVRHGVGWGRAEPLQTDPPVEDGPAWWVARDAVEAVEAESRQPGRGTRRTGLRCAEEPEEPGGPGGPDTDLVEALLVCQDLVVGSLSLRSVRLLRGLLDGRTQAELAAAEGVSPSAVSQRVRHDGLTALVDVDELIRRVP